MSRRHEVPPRAQITVEGSIDRLSMVFGQEPQSRNQLDNVVVGVVSSTIQYSPSCLSELLESRMVEKKVVHTLEGAVPSAMSAVEHLNAIDISPYVGKSHIVGGVVIAADTSSRSDLRK